jgi:hypothetical protein
MELEEYRKFISTKQLLIQPSGFTVLKENLNTKLFEWQKDIVIWALKKGKSALFEDCGLGKTPQQLEWAYQVCLFTGGNVLILAPLAVAQQTIKEGIKFGIEINYAKNQREVKNGITITNYEMLDNFNSEYFEGVVLDESSILKAYMGKTKQNILNYFKNTEFKLSCSATPAPNDHMELLNQAEFLGVMKSSEALAIWFINDTMNM